MTNLTPEQIADRCEDKDGLANIRAIRRVRKWQRDSGVALLGLEYACALDTELSNIVNDPNL